MPSAHMQKLASLRDALTRLERSQVGIPLQRASLGHAAVDASLQGGLALGTLHEVFAEEEEQGATAIGFAAGLLRRITEGTRHTLWIRPDLSAFRTGELAMAGLVELGLDPRRIIVVRAANAEIALRAAADGCACNAFGAVVTELWGRARAFDAVASRKLTLTTQSSGVTCLMLRLAAQPDVSTAETRWIVRAARSPPTPEWVGWGAPVFEAALVRNRHGPTGRWIMHWDCDECRFHEPAWSSQASHPQPALSQAVDRSHQAPAFTADARRRRQA